MAGPRNATVMQFFSFLFILGLHFNPFNPAQVVHRLSVLFASPLFFIKVNIIKEMREIIEVLSTIGVGQFSKAGL
jgi:hypothetical protein